ncbi:MAG TPA: globin domain-containing protein [Rhizorhapis sp.]
MLTCSVETLERSLEAVMEAGKDITPFFYDRFFALYPEQRANFYHFESTSGTMVNEMITSVLALASNEAWLTNSVQNFVAAHRSYGDIPPDAYARLLDVLVDTLAQVAGSRWTDEFETAWRWYVSGMKALIAEHV